MNPRYVKVYGDEDLVAAVYMRLHKLMYKWGDVGSYVAECNVAEVHIDCQKDGTIMHVEEIGYSAKKYNATELSLSDLFDGTFPSYVEEKPKPTKVRGIMDKRKGP